MTPTEFLRAKLDELGIKYTIDDSNDYEIVEWQGSYNLWWQFVYDPYGEEPYGELRLVDTGGATHLTPEQAIAATVGMTDEEADSRDLMEAIRDDDGVRYSMDEVMDIMRKDVAATVGAGTCKRIYHPNRITKTCTCSNCGYGASDERWAYCPKCGHKYVHGEVEEMWKAAGRKVAE